MLYQVVKALAILEKYDKGKKAMMWAEHDKFGVYSFAGDLEKKDFSEEDQKALDKLGWFWEEYGWQTFA